MPTMVAKDDSDDDDLESIYLNQQHGSGEDIMQQLIQRHLMSMFMPFSRRVDELTKKVDTVDVNMASLDSKAISGINSTTEVIELLRADIEKMRQEVYEVHSVVARTEAIEGQLEKLDADIPAMNERHRSLQALAYDMQQGTNANNHAILRLKSDLMSAHQSTGQKLEAALQHLEHEIATVGSEHDATAKSLRAAEKFQVDTRKDLLALTTAFEKLLRREDAVSTQVTKSLTNFDATLKHMDNKVQAQAEQLKAARASAAALQALVDQTPKSQAILDSQQKETHSRLGGPAGRLDDLGAQAKSTADAGAQAKGTATPIEGEGSRPRDILCAVSRLSEQVENNTIGIHNLTELISTQSELLESSDARVTSLEQGHTMLQGSTIKINEGLLQRISTVEQQAAQQERALQQERDRRAQEISGLQQSTTARFDKQANQIETVHELAAKSARELDAAGGHLRALRGELRATNEDIAKVRSTLDLTQENWEGLAKGFRQTHRSIKEQPAGGGGPAPGGGPKGPAATAGAAIAGGLTAPPMLPGAVGARARASEASPVAASGRASPGRAIAGRASPGPRPVSARLPGE